MADLEKKIKQIFERNPIPMDQLPSSNYITSTTKQGGMISAIKKDIDDVIDLIKAMSWKKITWTQSGGNYTPKLPTAITKKINDIFNGRSPGYATTYATSNMNAYKAKAIDAAKEAFITNSKSFAGVSITSGNIIMQIDSNQRTHFPGGGIPNKLRGASLGKKLYRGLIEQAPAGYVKTISNATDNAQRAWAGLIRQQFKSNGTTRDKDAEVYTFIIGSTLYAVSSTRADRIASGKKVLNKVTDKAKLFSKEVRKRNDIAVDEDFIKLCKSKKEEDRDAAQVVAWTSPTAEDKRRLAKEEKERIKREKAAKRAEEKRLERQIKARLKAYTGKTKIDDLQTDWEIGDMIVMRQYLLRDTYSTPIRKVTKKEGNTWYAYSLQNPTSDPRSTNDKTTWVKALMPAVNSDYPPGYYGTPASANRRRKPANVGTANSPIGSTGTTRSTTSAPTPANSTPASTTVDNNNIQSLFQMDAKKTEILGFSNPARKSFLRTKGDSVIYVPKPAFLAGMYKHNNVPIFGYFILPNLISNSKTMESIPSTDADKATITNNCFKFNRVPLEDKRDLSPGDIVFIRSHTKFNGYVATVIRTSLTTRGDKYIHLNVPGATRNKLTLTPRTLDKLVLIDDANESVQTKIEINPNPKSNGALSEEFFKEFNKIRENHQDDGKTYEDDSPYFDKITSQIIDYCEEVSGADFIPEEYEEQFDEELEKFKNNEANILKEIFEMLDGADFLPYDNDGSLPEPEEIQSLFDQL